MAEKILIRISRNVGYLGIIAGAYCGFLARDEYNFSTFSRVQELSDEYYRKDELLDVESQQLQAEVSRLRAVQQANLQKKEKVVKQPTTKANNSQQKQQSKLPQEQKSQQKQ